MIWVRPNLAAAARELLPERSATDTVTIGEMFTPTSPPFRFRDVRSGAKITEQCVNARLAGLFVVVVFYSLIFIALERSLVVPTTVAQLCWVVPGLLWFVVAVCLLPSLVVYFRKRSVRVEPEGTIRVGWSVAGVPILRRSIPAEEVVVRLHEVRLASIRGGWEGWSLVLVAPGFFLPLSCVKTRAEALGDLDLLQPELRRRYEGEGCIIQAWALA